ncbi:MAG: hypothetical protein WC797_01955 [Candidatus Paceibacterota bacterium]|jgi:hypothetical protein
MPQEQAPRPKDTSPNEQIRQEEINFNKLPFVVSGLPDLPDLPDVIDKFEAKSEEEEFEHTNKVLKVFLSDTKLITEELNAAYTRGREVDDIIIFGALARTKRNEEILEDIVFKMRDKPDAKWEGLYWSLLDSLNKLAESPKFYEFFKNDKEGMRFALSFIERNAADIAINVSRGHAYGVDALSFRALEKLNQKGSTPKQRSLVKGIFFQIEEDVFSDLDDENDNGIGDEIVSVARVYSRSSDKIFSIIRNKLYSAYPEKASRAGLMLGRLLGDSEKEEIRNKARVEITDYLKWVGVDAGIARDLLNIWLTINAGESEHMLPLNMRNVAELEKERPGSVEFLYREYGIKIFGRYPVNLLIKQVDAEGDTKTPYGIVVYPKSDYNGAFYENKGIFSSLGEQLGDEYLIRFSEAKSGPDFLYRIYSASKKFGKISFAVVGGHGEQTSIQYGNPSASDSFVYLKDLGMSGASKVSRHFIDEPTFILVSCETGKGEGMAQRGSKIISKAKFLAPEQSSNIRELKVSGVKEHKLHFQAKYSKGETKKYFGGVDVSDKQSRWVEN